MPSFRKTFERNLCRLCLGIRMPDLPVLETRSWSFIKMNNTPHVFFILFCYLPILPNQPLIMIWCASLLNQDIRFMFYFWKHQNIGEFPFTYLLWALYTDVFLRQNTIILFVWRTSDTKTSSVWSADLYECCYSLTDYVYVNVGCGRK